MHSSRLQRAKPQELEAREYVQNRSSFLFSGLQLSLRIHRLLKDHTKAICVLHPAGQLSVTVRLYSVLPSCIHFSTVASQPAGNYTPQSMAPSIRCPVVWKPFTRCDQDIPKLEKGEFRMFPNC